MEMNVYKLYIKSFCDRECKVLQWVNIWKCMLKGWSGRITCSDTVMTSAHSLGWEIIWYDSHMQNLFISFFLKKKSVYRPWAVRLCMWKCYTKPFRAPEGAARVSEMALSDVTWRNLSGGWGLQERKWGGGSWRRVSLQGFGSHHSSLLAAN